MIGFAPAHIYVPACEVMDRLHAAGHEAYIAGGAVRDHLLGREQTDLDIATSAHPDEVKALFRKTFAVGEAFGVILVRHRGIDFEVATFREEADYADGRRPGQVRYSTARADVLRRDFTINGMLWDHRSEEVLDWVEGRGDVERRLVRTIGDPAERFGEDRLRMLRALRFCAQLDFELDARTLEAIRGQARHLERVSLERVRVELDKLMVAPATGRALDLLEDSGLGVVLRGILLGEAERFAGRRPLIAGTAAGWDWARACVAADPPRELRGTAARGCLLLDVAGWEPERWTPASSQAAQHLLECLGRALRLSREELAALKDLAAALFALGGFAELGLADQLRALRRPACRWLPAVLERLPGWVAPSRPQLEELAARHSHRWRPAPLLDGGELLAAGVPAGPALGALLFELETLQLEDKLRGLDEARAWLQGRLASLSRA